MSIQEEIGNDCDQRPLVSVVVPVYNVENYLDRCVESLIVQTLENIEIILVDDGSTDKSSMMCDEWATKDGRIRVVHKENGGLSDARNAGVRIARAQWVGFVDSDDYVSPEMYKTLYYNAMEEQAEIAICGVCDVYDGTTRVPSNQEAFLADSQLAIELCLEGDIVSVTSVNRLYKKEILLDVPFPVGKATEDGFTVVEFFLRCQRVSFDLRPQYYYEHHEGTLSSMAYCSRKYDVIEAYWHNRDLIQKFYPQLIELANFRLFWAHFDVLDSMFMPGAEADSDRRDEIVRFLRCHRSDILSNRFVGSGRKLAMRALSLSLPLYRCISRAYIGGRKYK